MDFKTPHVTEEKAEWIEEQVNRMFEFSLETRRLLTADAHTTVNWMLGIELGAFGYLVSLAKAQGPTPLWVLLPLWFVVIAIGVLGCWFCTRALRVSPVHVPGNTPAALLRAGFIEYGLDEMRIADCRGVDDRTTETREENKRLGSAINQARLCLLLIPLLAALVGAIAYAFT